VELFFFSPQSVYFELSAVRSIVSLFLFSICRSQEDTIHFFFPQPPCYNWPLLFRHARFCYLAESVLYRPFHSFCFEPARYLRRVTFCESDHRRRFSVRCGFLYRLSYLSYVFFERLSLPLSRTLFSASVPADAPLWFFQLCPSPSPIGSFHLFYPLTFPTPLPFTAYAPFADSRAF